MAWRPKQMEGPMFGAFMTGILGRLIMVAGWGAFILSVVSFQKGGDFGPLAGLVGIVLLILGSYLEYKSKHTTQIRP